MTAIFFTLATLILVGMYLYAPFTQRRGRRVLEEDHELSALMAERDRVLGSLQELDFDFKLGKIPEGEYPAQRTNLLNKGADILRKIDSITTDPGSNSQALKGTPLNRRGESEEERIERAISARRADASAKAPELTDDDVESMISTRRKGRKNKSAGFCPNCGKPIMATDRFCPSCGKSLR